MGKSRRPFSGVPCDGSLRLPATLPPLTREPPRLRGDALRERPCHATRRHVDMSSSYRPSPGKANCASCAAVCCRLVVVLEAGDDIPAALTAELPQGHRVMAHAEDGWCVAMDRTHMNCGIYANRPAVCRRFVMNGPYCKAIRADYAKQAAPTLIREDSKHV